MALRLAAHLVAVALLGTSAAACGGHMTVATAPRIPMAPPGVYVDDDVAQGYAAYADVLAPAGRWDGDGDYGVHWCPEPSPTGVPYRPYVTSGHWAVSQHDEYGAAPGSVYWVNDDPAPWMEITAHHGWWVDLGDRAIEWCWVPGAGETPARVVWRTGDDFVGWAAEPPAWVDDGGENEQVGFEWTFELLGTLLEDAADVFELAGDIAQLAADATSPEGRTGPGPGLSRRPPAPATVHAARDRLVAYARDHASASPLAAAESTGKHDQTAAGHASSSAGGASSSSKQDSGDKPAVVVVERLPPPVFFMPMVGLDPTMVAAGGVTGSRTDESAGAVASRDSFASSGASPGRSLVHTMRSSGGYHASGAGRSTAASYAGSYAHSGGSSSSSSHSSGSSSSGHSSSSHSSSSHSSSSSSSGSSSSHHR